MNIISTSSLLEFLETSHKLTAQYFFDRLNTDPSLFLCEGLRTDSGYKKKT